MLRRCCTVAAALAVTAVLAACGEDREGSVEPSGGTTGTTGTTTTPAASGGSPVATVKVRETEYELDPKSPDVAKAGLVRFQIRNAGKIAHALEIEGPRGEVETDEIEPGKSATLDADLSKPGTYKWYCPIADHESRGMKGQITVAGGGSGAAKEDSGKDGDDREKPGGSGGDKGDARPDKSDARPDKSGRGSRDGVGGGSGGSGVY